MPFWLLLHCEAFVAGEELYAPMRCKRHRLVLRTMLAFCEPPRSNLRSLAHKWACSLVSLDYQRVFWDKVLTVLNYGEYSPFAYVPPYCAVGVAICLLFKLMRFSPHHIDSDFFLDLRGTILSFTNLVLIFYLFWVEKKKNAHDFFVSI